jgi:hypothetical protein
MENLNQKTDLSKVNNDILTNLATAEPVMNLVKNYATFEKDKPKRFVFAGNTIFTKENINENTGEITYNDLPAINLIDAEKNMFISASNVIVNACKDLPDFTALEITLTGQKKLSGGKKLNEFSVKLLNV